MQVGTNFFLLAGGGVELNNPISVQKVGLDTVKFTNMIRL